MVAMDTDKSLLAAYGALLEYPGHDLQSGCESLQASLLELAPEAASWLEGFMALFGLLSRAALEEQYTRAFDLAPQAVPYLSVYLFGPEGTQRGPFMAGLNGAYAEAGFDGGSELPDHVSLVLRFLPLACDEDYQALRAWCLLPPIRQMARDLERAANPYGHLMHSLAAFLGNSADGDSDHV